MEVKTVTTNKTFDQSVEFYKKKYEMVKEKFDIQEKYRVQDIQTIKLSY